MNEQEALALLDQLLDLDASARAARLQEIAAGDSQLAQTLQVWLAADAREDARVDRGLVRTLVLDGAGPTGIAAGDRVGAYRLVRELGRGGMGQVWLAERADGEFTQQVALKLIHPDLASPEAAPRFRRERQILAGLRHPNIAQLLDGGVTTDGRPWLAMEWVEGVSLREELRRGPLPMRRVVAFGAQIAEALAHAHGVGVVHRDLKPENVLVTREGYAKVLDFGIAKLLGGDEAATTVSATQPGLLLGTVAYMSPEQASGQAVDFRSDQFALGTVLYELATGQSAFARDTQRATLSAVLTTEPALLSAQTGPQIPRELAQVLRRCLAKEPSERYAATLDLAHDLKAIQSGTYSGPVEPLPRRSGTRGWVMFAAGAAIALLASAAWWMTRPVPTRLSAPQVQAELVIAPAERLGVGSFPMHQIAISPDGRQIVFTGVQDGTRRLYLRDLGAHGAAPLPGTEFAANPVFSPDGEWIAYFANQKLKTISVAGGGARVVADAPNVLGGMVWDRHDRILFSPFPGTGIWQVAVEGGEAIPVTTPDPAAGEGSHVWPAQVPGSDLLLYVAEIEAADSFDAGRIYAYDPATRKRTLLVDGGSDPTVVDDTLYFARAGIVYAARFDRERVAVVGSPKPLLEGITYAPATGAAQFAATRGASVYVPGKQGWDLWEPVIVDRAGVAQALNLPPDSYQHLRVSPDGRRVVLQITAADDDIWVYDFERRVLGRITNAGENLHPTWAPDGQWLIYAHHGTPTPPPPSLYRRRADGSGEGEELIESEGTLGAQLFPDVSPDGRQVMYSRYSPEHNFDLHLLDLQTHENRLWLQTPDADQLPRWSPDGRWIAWTKAPSSTQADHVLVQSVQGESRRWQISTEGGINAQWRGDGRALFFVHEGGLYEVDIAAGDDLAPSSPRLLFQGDYNHRYAAFPDGERFVMLRRVPEPGATGPILLDLQASGPD